jgi:hypothetical protein
MRCRVRSGLEGRAPSLPTCISRRIARIIAFFFYVLRVILERAISAPSWIVTRMMQVIDYQYVSSLIFISTAAGKLQAFRRCAE